MTKEEAVKIVAEKLSISEIEAMLIIDKAEMGGEIKTTIDNWLEERFLPNVVSIGEDGYAHMCIDALKILGKTASTDFGGSRQRDLGQMWADMTRGYLGELALKIFLEEKWGVAVDLGHESGEVVDYLPSDIQAIKKQNEENFRIPKLNIGIKATKWNGIWFDLPNDQFNHSDAHVMVKVGVGRDHLFAYFKKISVFKDKVLRVGQDKGLLSEVEAGSLYDKLPTFKSIPAYICGFVAKDKEYASLSYSGKKGRKNFKITEWNGPIVSGDLDKIKKAKRIRAGAKVEFEGIGKFNHDNGYLFNTGNLSYSQAEWKGLIDRI